MNPHNSEQSAVGVAVGRGLAVIGFAALVGFGIWLAIYSSRFIPTAVESIGAAAVTLSSVFQPSDATLEIVPATTTPIFFGEATSTSIATKEDAGNQTKNHPSAIVPKPELMPPTVTEIGTSSNTDITAILSGLPDLVPSILETGYMTSTSTDSFIASPTVPKGMRPAVKFIIKNVGTNIVEAGWHFSVALPTQSGYVYPSSAMAALAPERSGSPYYYVSYTLGFDQPRPGVGHSISIVADSDQRVTESIEDNNSASAQITVLAN